MKYSSKFKTPKHQSSTGANRENREPSPPPPPDPPASPRPHPKKEKTPISYFKQEQEVSRALREMERAREGKGKEVGRVERMRALLGNIMTKHMEMKRKIERLKREKQNREEASLMELTFEPKICANPRYPVHTPMHERNKSWDEARAQHFTSIRQEIVENQIRECTFSPRFVSKPKSQRYLKEREFKTHVVKDERENEEVNKLEGKFIKMPHLSATFEVVKPKKPTIDILSIKTMIKSEISRIPFNF